MWNSEKNFNMNCDIAFTRNSTHNAQVMNTWSPV